MTRGYITVTPTHTPAVQYADRKRRLKLVFEGRCRQLDAAKGGSWPPDYEARCAYSTAVRKYTRARTAWRNIRGWA